MIIEQPSPFLKFFYPQAIWRKKQKEKVVYLTFDDGPIPKITPWVLDQLKELKIQATFFCVGENVKKYPEIFNRIKKEGHVVGNHTYNHMTGFFKSKETYINNVELADTYIKSKLFRPPHGHLTKGQYKELKKKYKIVMWDLITRDYNSKLKPEKVFKIVKRYVRNGSIIVFHDSLKAEKNMKYAMPAAVKYLLENNYTFKTL